VEEVPELVTKLLSEAVDRLQEVSTDTTQIYSEIRKQAIDFDNYSFGASKIDGVRRILADIDYRLADCGMMLEGMNQLENQPPPSTDPATGTTGNSAIDQINAAAALAAQSAQTLEGSDNE
jgi:hypothetical protein